MRKRIGVVIGEVSHEYQQVIMKRIADKATALGYDVIFICIYGSYKDGILYTEGEKACLYIPDYSMFDGLIVAEDVIDISKIQAALYKEIMSNAKCPVVYLRTKRDGCYSILIDNKKAMKNMTNHFIKEHGFTDICYMSGKKNSTDSIERLQGFMEAMTERGLTVTDNMIYHGDFWKRESKKAAEWFMQGRTTFPQAIICANDYMAVSLCDEFKKMGARIPEDICFSGFDNVMDSRIYEPPLTTIEVDFEILVDRAIDIIEDVNNGVEVVDTDRIDGKIHFRGSCCADKFHDDSKLNVISLRNTYYSDTRDLLVALTDYQECAKSDEYLKIAHKHFNLIKSNIAYLVFNDDSDENKNDEAEHQYTEQMILKGIVQTNQPLITCDIKFPRKQLIPAEYWNDDKPTVMCIFGLHFQSKVYGYIVTDIPDGPDWFNVFTQGYVITLSNAIEQHEHSETIHDLETIKKVYNVDSLTGILNRNGFNEIANERFESIKSTGSVIGVVSVDMDNLKMINDTYGHASGDNALQVIAKALAMSINDGEYCARIGGDEFVALIDTTQARRCAEFKKVFFGNLQRLNQDIDLYQVGASIGICESNEQGTAQSLPICLQIADKRMYDDKRARKMQRQ